MAQLDDGSRVDVRHIDSRAEAGARYVERLELGDVQRQAPLTRLAADAIGDADAIILGPGSLYESILPNFLIEEFAAAVRASTAVKIYVCNLMTEPGRTSGFSVADHIRAIREYAALHAGLCARQCAAHRYGDSAVIRSGVAVTDLPRPGGLRGIDITDG